MKLQENLIMITFPQNTEVNGLFVPKKQTNTGFVVATVVDVGPGRLNPYNSVRVPTECKKGDRVLVNLGSCIEIKMKQNSTNDEHLYILDGKEVLAILAAGEDIIV